MSNERYETEIMQSLDKLSPAVMELGLEQNKVTVVIQDIVSSLLPKFRVIETRGRIFYISKSGKRLKSISEYKIKLPKVSNNEKDEYCIAIIISSYSRLNISSIDNGEINCNLYLPIYFEAEIEYIISYNKEKLPRLNKEIDLLHILNWIEAQSKQKASYNWANKKKEILGEILKASKLRYKVIERNNITPEMLSITDRKIYERYAYKLQEMSDKGIYHDKFEENNQIIELYYSEKEVEFKAYLNSGNYEVFVGNCHSSCKHICYFAKSIKIGSNHEFEIRGIKIPKNWSYEVSIEDILNSKDNDVFLDNYEVQYDITDVLII